MTIVKFPSVSRRAHARRPRISTNGTPEERAAEAAADPIFGMIERHRAACADHDGAVKIEFAFEEIHMQGEKLRQYQVLHAQTADAWDRLEDASTDLVLTPPTTLAGIAAVCRYIEPLLADVDTSYLPDTIACFDDDESTPAGALANTIAATIEGMLASNPQGGEA